MKRFWKILATWIFLALPLALLAAAPALAQSVQQSGTVTRNHVPVWNTSGVISDGGSSADSPITSIGVTNNGGAGFCVSSDRQTAAGRNQLCFGASTTGAATISLQNYGTASAQNLQFVINGTAVVIPTGGNAFIFGNGPFTSGDVPCFSGTSGLVVDCGLALAAGTVTSGVWQGTPVALGFGGTGGTSAASARTNLGLGTLATQNSNNISVTGGAITGMPTPANASDVAIKSYVDSTSTGLNILAPSRLATAAILPNSPVYSNGASGVGATLTSGVNSTLTVDGTTANLNDVVLVKNQASTFQNGVYTVTAAGSGAATWVLTRATYFDQTAEMKVGSYTFITAGSTNINSAWTMQSTVVTVGTDAVTFVQFSSSGTGTVTNVTIAASTGIAATGTCTITSSGTCTISNTGVTTIASNTGAFTLAAGVNNSTNQIQQDGNYGGWALQNCTLAASVGSNLLTVALKDNAGSDPSATSPCNINYRSATASTGSTTLVQQAAALSISTFATGATLGSSSGKAFRFWVVVFNNNGTNVLALINCSNSTTIFPLNEGTVATTVAISGSATSAGVFYTPNGTTATNAAFRILGYVEYNSTGLVTAGTYASGPNFIQIFGPGIKKPGDSVQRIVYATSTTTNTTSTTKTATAISGAISPTSAANLIKAEAKTDCLDVSAAQNGLVQLGRTSNANMFGSQIAFFTGSANSQGNIDASGYDAPNTTSSTTYSLYSWVGGSSGNFTVPATAVSKGAGAAAVGQLVLEELQG